MPGVTISKLRVGAGDGGRNTYILALLKGKRDEGQTVSR